MTNPWLTDPETANETETEHAKPAPAWEPPKVTVVPTATLPIGPPPPDNRLTVMGAHGGAGTTTWAYLLNGLDSGATWPGPTSHPLPTIIVARSHLAGLVAAHNAGLQWASQQVPHINIIGLLLAPDIPGRQPKELQDQATNLESIYPRVWRVPHQNAWRTQTPPKLTVPRQIQAIITDILGGPQ